MVGGDLCGSPIIPNAPCRRGLRPLVPRGRRGKEGGAGREVSGGVSFPSPVQLLPSGRRFIHLAGAAARGQGSGAGAGAAGQRPPVQRREGPRGAARMPGLPSLCFQQAQPRGWAQGLAWASRKAGPPRPPSCPVASTPPPGCQAQDAAFTHTRPSSPSFPLCSPGSPALLVPFSGVRGTPAASAGRSQGRGWVLEARGSRARGGAGGGGVSGCPRPSSE